MLVLIGATSEGKRTLGFQTGIRESAQSWCELLADVERRSQKIPPDIAAAVARLASGRRSTRLSLHQAPTLLGAQDRPTS
ncbi:hypothetical protein NKH63_26250 [Mesorhizobium sp. M0960]